MEESKTIDLSNRVYKLVAIFLIIISLFSLGLLWYQFKSLPQNFPQQISVNGEGRAYVTPDIATITLGMSNQGLNSQDIINKNNTAVNSTISALKDIGIDEKDIKTTSYNLYPTYDYTEFGRIFRGYTLDQQISVKIRDFDKISMVLEKSTASGLNTIGDLMFTVDDKEKAKSQARSEAIAKAKEKAMAIASGAGLKLGKLINVYENEGYGYPQPAYGLGGTEMLRSDTVVAPQIQEGQNEIAVVVTLIYEVR